MCIAVIWTFPYYRSLLEASYNPITTQDSVMSVDVKYRFKTVTYIGSIYTSETIINSSLHLVTYNLS